MPLERRGEGKREREGENLRERGDPSFSEDFSFPLVLPLAFAPRAQ